MSIDLMFTQDQVKTISDLRESPRETLEQLARGRGPFYLMYRSRLKEVLVDPESFARLQELAEDYLDAQEATGFESEDKSRVDWVSHGELVSD